MQIVRWTGRILGLVSLGFVLLFLIGEGSMEGFSRLTPKEMWLFLFFPIGVTVGNLVGWWREGWGACLTLGSLAAFYLLDLLFSGDFPSGPFFVFVGFPGFLFATYWFLARRSDGAVHS